MRKSLKRVVALSMTMMLLVASFTGCGSDGDSNSDADKKSGSAKEFEKVDTKTNVDVVDLGGYEFTVAANLQYYDDPSMWI